MLLYIVRHGEPGENGALTEKGQKQAEAVGERLFKSGIDRVYSSPLLRARQTAEPLCRLLSKEMHIEDWAHEIGDERITTFPDGERKSVSLLQNTVFRTENNINLPFDKAFKADGFKESGMEGAVKYIEENGDNFLEKLGYKKENGVYRILRNNDEKVALFCHAAFGRAWISTLLHIPVHIMWASFDYAHSGVTVLEFQNNENGITAPVCLCYSDLSHLYANNLSLCIDERVEM